MPMPPPVDVPNDPSAATLVLSQRVTALDRDMTNLGNSLSSQITQLANNFSSQVQTLANQIQNLSNKMQEGTRTPWGILIAAAVFLLGFVAAIGGLAYSPILSTTSRLESALDKQNDRLTSAIASLAERVVTREELDARTLQIAEDRQRVETWVRALQGDVFPKEVHLQRWERIDADAANAARLSEARDNNLQREIDVLQKQLGDTYTARDALLDLRTRLDTLERELRSKP